MSDKKEHILERCRILDISCDINSPGDGATRYNFFTKGPVPFTFGRRLGMCLGIREARIFLCGYEEGRKSRGEEGRG